MKKNRKRRLVIKFLIIGTFLGFKVAQSDFSLFINDAYSPSFTSASGTISYSGSNFQVLNFSTGLDLANATGVTIGVFNVGSTGFTSLGLTGSISITTEPTYGTATTGITNSTYLAVTYQPNQNSLVSYPIDSLEFQICADTPQATTTCATGSIDYQISNSNGSVTGVNNTGNFYIQSGDNTIIIDVLNNDIGTGRYLSGLSASTTTGTATITGSLLQQLSGSNQKIMYSYTGSSIPSPNPIIIAYSVCVYTTCDTANLSITFLSGSSSTGTTYTGTVTGVNDTTTFDIAGSGTADTITINVLTNDIGSGLFLSGLVSQPAIGSATTTGSQYSGLVLYTYTGTSLPSSSGSFSYQVCNDGNCDNAIVYINYNDSSTVSGINDSVVFPLGSGTTSVTVDVLSNDIGTGLVLSGITSNPSTGTAMISGTAIKYSYPYTGNTQIHGTYDTLTYQVCNNISTCTTATLTINFQDRTQITCTDDYRFYNLSGSNGNVNITRNVLRNDYYGSIVETGLLVKTLTGTQPSVGTATIIAQNTEINYNYIGSGYDTGDVVTIGYQCCSAYNSGDNCSDANFIITFTDTDTPGEFCEYPGDEDNDGASNCADLDCNGIALTGGICQSTGEVSCGDAFDNDGDGDIDCADSNCDGQIFSGQLLCQDTETTCNDTFDNDGDGDTDCNDSDCSTEEVCNQTGSIEICTNGIDDDSDSAIDCADSGCNNQLGSGGTCQFGTETSCEDNFDNDGDGDVDCDDNDCSSSSACQSTGATEICNNGQDDDSDGKADCADLDCAGETGSGGIACEPAGETTCNDGKDNDVDGSADCDDSDCSSSSACQSGGGRSSEICNNGQDDDADGFADCFDSDCTNSSVCLSVCGNGIKNSGEQCDDGNTSNEDGCNSSCNFETPDCNNISYSFGADDEVAKLTISSLNNQSTRTTVTSLDRGDNSNKQTNTSFPQSHTYTKLGTYQTQVILKNNLSGSITKTCEESITIGAIPGCTDSEATNYDPNATVDDDSCRYNSNNLSCGDASFSVSEDQPDINESVYFLRSLNSQIKGVKFYAGAGAFETDPISPKEFSYSLAGTYNAQLVLIGANNQEKTCKITIDVGKKGCVYEDALNYDPNAYIDDGSCIFDDAGGYYDDCGNSRLDPGEECDDGNNYNGDGCDSTCFIESGRTPYCGNAIVEIGEECDGGPYCNNSCYYYESNIIDEIRREVCFLNGQCDFGGENNFFFPENIPGVGPDDERLDIKIKKLGYQITQRPNINTDSLPRFTKIEKDSKHFEDPIYRIEEVLPSKYRSYKKFRVAPSIGSVSAIDEIHNPTKLNEFILGKPGDFQEKLLETAVHYAGSAEFGEGGNTVILGHSSQYVLPHQEDQEIGNAFKLLPLLQKNDKFYLVEKINGEYDIHTYRVTNKKIIEPNNSEILDQRNKGHKATLVTCYPIGSTTQRMVIEAEPISKLVDIRYTELLHELSAKQKIQLRAIAQKYYNKIDSENMFELIIHRLYLTRTNIKKRNDLTNVAKEKMDTAIQYIIYELTNTHL